MPYELKHLNKHLKNTSKEQLDQFNVMFLDKTCDSLIQFAAEATKDRSLDDKRYQLKQIYEFVFEYAISQNKNSFIEKMFLHEEIISNIDHKILFEYAKEQSLTFRQNVFIAIANFPNKSLDFYNIFKLNAENTFQVALKRKRGQTVDASLSLSQELIQTLLFNPKVTGNQKFLMAWWSACFIQLKRASSEMESYALKEDYKVILEAIIDEFFYYFPNEKNKENIENLSDFLAKIAFSENSSLVGEQTILYKFLDQYSFNSDEIIDVLENENTFFQTLGNLDLLIQRIDRSHAKYGIYKHIYVFLRLPPNEQLGYLLTHQKLLSTEVISAKLQFSIFKNLGGEVRKACLEWYIGHANFEYGPLLKDDVFKYGEEFWTRYLNAAHVELPTKCLTNIIRNTSKVFTHIKLLLTRPDCKFKKGDLFRPLLTLFQRNDIESFSLLLNHPSAAALLMQYHQLSGDDELHHDDRGMLMPVVLAWYIKFSDKHKDIFLSIPIESRDGLLKRCVPSLIDSNQPNLRAFIVQSGKSDLIEAIGGINPRLVHVEQTGQYEIYMPTLFSKSVNAISIMQRKIVSRFADNRGQKMHLAAPISEMVQARAKQAVQASRIPLFLQHETEPDKAKKIIGDGYFKSRLHLQGHSLTGQASNGLMNEAASLTEPKSAFSYFTRVLKDGTKSSHFHDLPKAAQGCFVLNAQQLFVDNPDIVFMIIGPYPHFKGKNLKISNDYTVVSNPCDLQESREMIKIKFGGFLNVTLNRIQQKLFELVFEYFIKPMPEKLRAEVIQRFVTPTSEEDYQLIQNLVDLLNLEWLIPGDVPLKLSYVEKIELGESTYNLAALRYLVLNSPESDVLKAIDDFKDIKEFPFVLQGILEIARKRRQIKVIDKVLELEKNILRNSDNIIYYPSEVYQIESLAQLILEDLNNDRVYIRYRDNKIFVRSILQANSNRSSAHHAEMPKLHFALGIGDFSGKNALAIQLDDNLIVDIGAKGQFKSLAAMRDTLLTHEITTLLVSQQNYSFYANNKGEFHPITGKGATNGVIALLKEKLFKDNAPYRVKVTCDDKKKQIIITTDLMEMTSYIATTICDNLNISPAEMCTDENMIVINLSAADLIAKLRQRAIFYEGINVITEDGRLLLAERHGRGLASAGGHHSNKYTPEDISYGLRSEFGLEFRLPKALKDSVIILSNVKTIAKTGIYVVSASALQPTEKAKNYAEEKKIDIAFQADPDEFVPGSEVALTLVEMRGKQFYDVVPLAELCHYQLNELDQGLKQYFSGIGENIKLTIDNQIDNVAGAEVSYKVPGLNFGRVKIVVNGELPEQLAVLLLKNGGVREAENVYTIDQSPLFLLQAIKQENKQFLRLS